MLLINNIAPDFPNHEVDSIYTLRPEFAEALATDRIFGLLFGGILAVDGRHWYTESHAHGRL